MKRYDQYCPIACSLSLVGERWTLLVVRELMHGPKRYTDLVAGLHRHRHEHPRRPAEGARGCRARRAAEAAAARRFDRLRADTDRPGAPPCPARAGTVRRATDGPAAARCARTRAGSSMRSISRFRRSRRLVVSHSASATRRPHSSKASLVPGLVDDPDVFVESDAIGFYHLVVNRQTEGVRIEGDRRGARTADRRVRAEAGYARAASRLITSHARRTSSSVVRALPTASRSV